MNLSPTITTRSVKLTKLERRWYNEYLNCFNATDALYKAYPDNKYTVMSARAIASQTKRSVFRKLNFTDNNVFELMGVTEECLARKGTEGLNATRPIVIDGKPQAVADYATRHRYWQDLMKMKNIQTDKVELTGADGGPLQVQAVLGVGFLNKREAEDANNSVS